MSGNITSQDIAWVVAPVGTLSTIAVVVLGYRTRRVMSTLRAQNDCPCANPSSDTATVDIYQELNSMPGETRHKELQNAMGVTHGDARRIISRVFNPMAAFAFIGFLAAAAVVVTSVAYRHQVREIPVCQPYGDWAPHWTTLSAAFMLAIGFSASFLASMLYNLAAPLIGLDVAIQVARDSSANGLSQATGVMNWGNVCLGVLVVSAYIAVALVGSVLGDYGYGCAYAGSLFTVCGAVGSHVATFVMSCIGNSFAEGMAISLYKVEADTQHRVDGTLRIAANTLQSSAGLPMAIGSSLLDVHALYLLMFFTDTLTGHFYLIPALASACLVGAIALAVLAPASTHRGLVRKARASLVTATCISVGLGIGVISLFAGEHRPFSLPDGTKNQFIYSYVIGALVQLVIVLSIEFTSFFARVAGEHCDISTTATLNSIASFGNIYAFVALSIAAAALNTIWWAWGPMCTVIALAGGVLSLLPTVIAFANARCIASSALCYSKASLMDPPEQELLEHLLYRCELLELYAHNSIAYLPTIVLMCICYALLPATYDEANTVTLASVSGVCLALLSDGLTRFYFSRTTWRLRHTVKTPASAPSSISGDSVDDSDDPLKGDRVIGVIAIVHVLMQILVLYLIKAFIGNTGTVWALMYGAIVVIVNCTRHSAEGALGAAVKNFVVQGGMAYAARYSTQHNNAVQAAASTTPLPMASNIIALSIWRVSIVAFFVAVLAFENIVMQNYD